MNPTINGRYNEVKLEQVWTQQREEYTACKYYRICIYARPVKLCLDKPDECPVRIKLDSKKLEGLVEEFPK